MALEAFAVLPGVTGREDGDEKKKRKRSAK
jgi:hypothetical protein